MEYELIRNALRSYTGRKKLYIEDNFIRLYPSEVGVCPRKTMHRLIGSTPTIDFDEKTLEKMHNGNVMEDDTINALRYEYGERHVHANVGIRTHCWAGLIDCILHHGHGCYKPVIIEHKWTASWKGVNGWLPYSNHLQQLMVYGYMYEEKFNVKPELRLFYRSHKNYAEFTAEDRGEYIQLNGYQDGYRFTKQVEFNTKEEIKSAENLLHSTLVDPIKVLPPITVDKDSVCCFRGTPSCSYYYNCYPEELKPID